VGSLVLFLNLAQFFAHVLDVASDVPSFVFKRTTAADEQQWQASHAVAGVEHF